MMRMSPISSAPTRTKAAKRMMNPKASARPARRRGRSTRSCTTSRTWSNWKRALSTKSPSVGRFASFTPSTYWCGATLQLDPTQSNNSRATVRAHGGAHVRDDDWVFGREVSDQGFQVGHFVRRAVHERQALEWRVGPLLLSDRRQRFGARPLTAGLSDHTVL